VCFVVLFLRAGGIFKTFFRPEGAGRSGGRSDPVGVGCLMWKLFQIYLVILLDIYYFPNMPNWTTELLVRNILQGIENNPLAIVDEAHLILNNDPIYLSYRGITAVTVKRIYPGEITKNAPIILTGTTPGALENNNLVPGSFALGSDDRLSIFYYEGIDFIVSYTEGTITRIAGGNIISGSSVVAFYCQFVDYTVDVDYDVDRGNGTITRIPTGIIPLGSLVYVNYTLSGELPESSMIGQGITDAEGMIIDKLSSEYSASSTDQGLVTGATFLAVSYICFAMSSKNLSLNINNTTNNAAQAWINLGLQYFNIAFKALSKYLKSPSFSKNFLAKKYD
jgi:hypothetical protein